MGWIFGVARIGGAAVRAPGLTAIAEALTPAGTLCESPTIHIDDTVALGCGAQRDDSSSAPDTGLIRRGEVLVACDGWIDAREDLSLRLGIDAQATPVAELLACAYERWGTQMLAQLCGEFSVAVWDRAHQRLLLGASAPLSRPLVYHHSEELFCFATRARGLFALDHIQPTIDERKAVGYFLPATGEHRRSWFAGIHKLLPGELLSVDRGGMRVARWWRPDPDPAITDLNSGAIVEHCSEVLSAAVTDRLPPAGEAGLMLSGGLDSGAVAATAAPLLARRGRRLHAYTEVPATGLPDVLPERYYADEGPLVRELAAMYPNLELCLVRDVDQNLLAECETFFALAETPAMNPFNRGWLEAIQRRARDDGVALLLNGDHGNLTLSWAGEGPRTRARQLARSLRSLRRAPGRLDPYTDLTLLAPALVSELGLAREDPLANGGRLSRREDSRDTRVRIIAGVGVLAAAIDGSHELRFGVRSRAPLTDRRLVELCLSLPDREYRQGDQSRLLIRRMLAGRLPDRSLNQRTRGLQGAGWHAHMIRELPELSGAVVAFARDPLVCRVLDIPRLAGLLRQWPATDPTSLSEIALYRGAVGKALMLGAFLQWAQRPSSWPRPVPV